MKRSTVVLRLSVLAGLVILLSGATAWANRLNIVRDGGFEKVNGVTRWFETSTNFDDLVICSQTLCGSSINHARTGDYWLWLGHNISSSEPISAEIGSASQRIDIPARATKINLSFWMKMSKRDGDTPTGDDRLQINIDNNPVLTITDMALNDYLNYRQLTLDVTERMTSIHALQFRASLLTDTATSFFIDDVELLVDGVATTTYLPMIVTDSCTNKLVYDEDLNDNRMFYLDRINVTEAWCEVQGNDIRIAVIDTGVDLDHPELQANLLPGATFAGTSSPDDDDGHGTNVAGIIASIANNRSTTGQNVIGVAPQANIVPIKVLGGPSGSTSAAVAQGILWAVDRAEILNLSLGSVNSSQVIKNAIDVAHQRGRLLVAAAGNCGDNNYLLNRCTEMNQPSYPALYDEVMAVASTDSSNSRSSFSTQGSYVEIAAPGRNIYNAYDDGQYNAVSGTSQAAPHVAGLAALIWSKNPSLTHEQVRLVIRNSANRLNKPVPNNELGYGLIDAAAALDSIAGATLSNQARSVTPTIQPTVIDETVPFVSGQILVKFKQPQTRSLAQLFTSAGLSGQAFQVTQTLHPIQVQLITVPVGQEQMYVTQLNQSPAVEYAELNYYVTAY